MCREFTYLTSPSEKVRSRQACRLHVGGHVRAMPYILEILERNRTLIDAE